MFDYIGFGFCRYSTDRQFLVPHFEKMLYDNALLILAYSKAYAVTKKEIYLVIAEKTANYILREMTSPDGGFFSSQDADSEGEEGKYYLFTPDEITKLLGCDDGDRFNRHFDITDSGKFEGMNIPNLLKSDPHETAFDAFLPMIENYRKHRHTLHRDEKILTSWNSLMIAALCQLYLVSKKELYLSAAQRADRFIRQNLSDGNELYVSHHMGKRGVRGFLDDYASYAFAQLSLYRTTLDREYLDRVKMLCNKMILDFSDSSGGFYLYGKNHEMLILRPKETYDDAIPSGNSLMSYNLVRLSHFTDEERYQTEVVRQLDLLTQSAAQHPIGHTMFLTALLEHNEPPTKITVVPDDTAITAALACSLPHNAIVILRKSSEEYPLINGRTTYYVCHGRRCLPPTNDLNALR